jgi:hypothetical protein
MKAEMVADIRSYDPGQPTSPTTWAWDSTQQQVIGYTPLQTEWNYSTSM